MRLYYVNCKCMSAAYLGHPLASKMGSYPTIVNTQKLSPKCSPSKIFAGTQLFVKLG